MKTIDEEGHKYLRFLEYDKVKEKEMQTEFVRERNGKKKTKALKSLRILVCYQKESVKPFKMKLKNKKKDFLV